MAILNSSPHRLALIQVDGLSKNHLNQALKRGLMPNLQQRLEDGSLNLGSYHTGLPSQTTVAIGGLLYGQMLPGNQWYDKESGSVVDTFDMNDADQVADELAEGGEGLAKGGSVYLSPLDGEATASESHFVFSDMGRVKESQGKWGLARNAVKEFGGLLRHLVVHPGKAVQSAVHFAGEIAQDLRNRKTTGRKLKTIVTDAFKETLLPDAASERIASQIRKGDTPFLYIDLANFDAKNHAYGPGEEAFQTLPGIDRNLDTILDAVEESQNPYKVAILADHGSARAYHFHDIYGKSLQELSQELAPGHEVLSLDFGSGAHLYLTDQAGELDRSQLPDGLVEGLKAQEGIAFVVTREGERTRIESARGSIIVEGGRVSRRGSDPIAPFEDNPDRVAHQLHDLAHRDKVGDVMVFGELHKDGLIDFSTSRFQGLHGGIGLGQTEPFVAWNSNLDLEPSKASTSSSSPHRKGARASRSRVLSPGAVVLVGDLLAVDIHHQHIGVSDCGQSPLSEQTALLHLDRVVGSRGSAALRLHVELLGWSEQ